MKPTKIIVLIILFLSFLALNAGAQTAKRLTKKGAELEVSGMPEEAADYYYRALVKNSDYVDALIGLKRTAPKLMDRKLLSFNTSFVNEEYQAAYDKYRDAALFQSNLKNVGVEQEISKPYTEKFNECRNILAEQFYKSGNELLGNGSYVEAISDFEKCLSFVSQYKDAAELISQAKEAKAISDAERFYQIGLSSMDAGNFRKAYYDFGKCLAYKSPYKDALELKNESLEKGKVRIGIFEFTNDTKVFGASGSLYSYVVTNAVKYESPFIEIVDRDNLERLLNEQKLGMSGVVDESTASQAGKVLGLDYVVLGRLISATQTGGELTSQKITAYELYQSKTIDGTQVTKGKQVTYMLYQGDRKVTYEASYQLISVETSEIVSSEIVAASDDDHVKYATYNGDSKKLCRINPDGSTYSQGSISGNMVDQHLFSARQKLKSQEEMQPGIIKNLASQMANGICGQFK
jgi:tetratricopeptide (TPR) repeat protein